MAFNIANTTYGGGGVQTQSNALSDPALSGGGGFNFSAMGSGLGDALKFKLALALRNQELKEQQARDAHDQLMRQEQMQDNDRMKEATTPQVAKPRVPQQTASTQAEALGPKPADFGRYQMDKYGNWGTFVDPANIPASLQGTIMGGQYGQLDNWDSNNPSIMGPRQFKTGQYQHLSGSGPRVDPNSGGQAAQQHTQTQQDTQDLIQRYISQGLTPPKYLTGGGGGGS